MDGSGNRDAFISKLDVAGNVLWLRNFGTIARDGIEDVATDGFGNIYVAGLIGEESAGEDSSHTDAFLAKYDGAGNQLWLRRWGGALREVGLAVTTDPMGNAYLGGAVFSPIDGTVTKSIGFVTKFAPDGDLAWEYLRDSPALVLFLGLAADAEGSVYATGRQTTFVNNFYDISVVKLMQVAEPSHAMGASVGVVALMAVGRRRTREATTLAR